MNQIQALLGLVLLVLSQLAMALSLGSPIIHSALSEPLHVAIPLESVSKARLAELQFMPALESEWLAAGLTPNGIPMQVSLVTHRSKPFLQVKTEQPIASPIFEFPVVQLINNTRQVLPITLLIPLTAAPPQSYQPLTGALMIPSPQLRQRPGERQGRHQSSRSPIKATLTEPTNVPKIEGIEAYLSQRTPSVQSEDNGIGTKVLHDKVFNAVSHQPTVTELTSAPSVALKAPTLKVSTAPVVSHINQPQDAAPVPSRLSFSVIIIALIALAGAAALFMFRRLSWGATLSRVMPQSSALAIAKEANEHLQPRQADSSDTLALAEQKIRLALAEQDPQLALKLCMQTLSVHTESLTVQSLLVEAYLLQGDYHTALVKIAEWEAVAESTKVIPLLRLKEKVIQAQGA